MGKKKQRLEVTVKDTIDLIYEMTTANPEGIELAANSLGYTPSKVVSLLVERKTLERRTVSRANGLKCIYKWIATMAPTKVFYGSITQELRDRMREKNKKYKAKVEKSEKPVEPAKDEPVVTMDEDRIEKEAGMVINNLTEATKRNPLEIYGIDELVAELRRRECTIENNKIVLVKRVEYAL